MGSTGDLKGVFDLPNLIFLETPRKRHNYMLHFRQEEEGGLGAVDELAEFLNIELIRIPAGMTAICQPLDVSFNGPMSAARRKLWKARQLANPFIKDTWQ